MPTQPIYIFHYKKDAPAFGSSIRKIEMKEIDNFYISKSGEYIKHSVVERIGLEGDCLIHITFSRELSNKQKEKLVVLSTKKTLNFHILDNIVFLSLFLFILR